MTAPPMAAPTMFVVDAVLGGAALLLPVREIAGNATPNDGYMVRAIQDSTGNAEGDPWCASFLYYVGHGVLGKRWPLPRTAGCDVLLAFARQHRLTVPRPQRGDLFLVMRSANDATHTGFVTSAPALDGTWGTLEGNTNDGGSREGDGVRARRRGGKGDRTRYVYVRWAGLVPPAVPGAADGAPRLRAA